MTVATPPPEEQPITLRKGDRVFIGTALVEVASVDHDGTIYAFVREAGAVPEDVAP